MSKTGDMGNISSEHQRINEELKEKQQFI